MEKTKINHLSWTNYSGTADMQCEVPSLCPVCQVSFNPTYSFQSYEKIGKSDLHVVIAVMTCTYCGHKSVLVEEIEDSLHGHLLAAIPEPAGTTLNPLIADMSPRFTSLYEAAERCENNDDFDLAGMGFRAALEVLLKDYALEFELDTREVIANKNLNRCIDSYFTKNGAGFIAADVVRILGNDYTHWDRPESFDSRESLAIEKQYLDIFISFVQTQLMIKHPPVSRDHSSNSNNNEPSKS